MIDKEKKIQNRIGNDVWIGTDVIIMEGVTIGDGAVIGTGSVLTKDVPCYEVWAGVPAKKIKSRFSDTDNLFLLELQWWNKPIEWIEENAEYFENIILLKKMFSAENYMKTDLNNEVM